MNSLLLPTTSYPKLLLLPRPAFSGGSPVGVNGLLVSRR